MLLLKELVKCFNAVLCELQVVPNLEIEVVQFKPQLLCSEMSPFPYVSSQASGPFKRPWCGIEFRELGTFQQMLADEAANIRDFGQPIPWLHIQPVIKVVSDCIDAYEY